MRKPRVFIFNYSGRFQNDLITYFRNDDYALSVLTGYVTCPIYGEQENKSCDYPVPCCDIMVVVEDDEQIKGFDLFKKQFQLGCKLTHLNKAIITSSLVRDKINDFASQNTTIFVNPLDFIAFEAWVRDCERRIDLKQRLVAIRREDRHTSSMPVQFRLLGEDAEITAQAVNISKCGICLKISKSIRRGQELSIRSEKLADTEVGVVQWVKKLEEGWYLSGVTFCV